MRKIEKLLYALVDEVLDDLDTFQDRDVADLHRILKDLVEYIETSLEE